MSENTFSRYEPSALPWIPPWPVEIDLHLHTNVSDGTLTPTQLIDLVGSTNLKTIAITDHDTTAGMEEAIKAVKKKSSLQLIPGIELGSEIDGSEIHLIGLFINYHDVGFQQTITNFKLQRVEAAKTMVQQLNNLGIKITWEHVQKLAEGVVGRPHIARAMQEAGFVGSINEAFERYIGDDGPARVSRPKFDPVEALELITSAGGIGIIAHPRTVKNIESILKLLSDAGLAGIEVYAEKYGPEQHGFYASLANNYNLIPCGGTDYHNFGIENESVPGITGPPPDTAKKLYERALQIHNGNPGFRPKRPF